MKYLLFTTFIIWFFYWNIDILKEEQNILQKNNITKIENQTKKVITKAQNKTETDFFSDNSITKYVSPKNSFSDLKYFPNDLIEINSQNITKSKKSLKLRKEAFLNLEEMAVDFKKEFNKNLIVISAFRSYEYQIAIKKWNCSDNFCAKPWFSEHQTWLAIDFFETTTKEEFLSKKNLKKYFEWLNKNWYKYGFINTYKKSKEIDWYELEPWHRRYVWKEFAWELQENNLSFWEYFNKK